MNRTGARIRTWRAGPFVGAGLPALALVVVLLAGCSAPAHSPAALHQIRITQFKFVPPVLQVAPGDTVEWSNQDILPHTATARSGHWDSGTVAPGATWRQVMTQRGVESYACRFHPTMAGSVEVR
jgi:plastocyanin